MSNILNKNNISVVGLGKLGLPFALCLAKKNFNVIGIDINQKVINLLKESKSPIIEPGIDNLLKKVNKKFFPTTNDKKAIEESDITFIIVATPSDKKGNFSNKYVEEALKSLSSALKESKKNYHLFVIGSTVMPQSIEKRIIPLIEKYSQRELNKGFGVCYAPDFVALGRVIYDFLNPDLVLIGESNKFAGDQIEEVYKKLCNNKPPIHRTSIVNAEIAKMTLNAYITTKISFANTIGNLCERIPGADAYIVTKIISSDKRVSPLYIKPGLSFGGTCFPRDTKAFIVLSRKFKYNPELIKAIDNVNKFQDKHLLEVVLKTLKKAKENKVSILGLAFKPDTPVIEASPSMKLINSLLKHNVKIIAFDPLAIENTKAVFQNKIRYADSVKSCISGSKVLVIVTPYKEFGKILEKNNNKLKIVIDCWGIIKPGSLPRNILHIILGRYSDL